MRPCFAGAGILRQGDGRTGALLLMGLLVPTRSRRGTPYAFALVIIQQYQGATLPQARSPRFRDFGGQVMTLMQPSGGSDKPVQPLPGPKQGTHRELGGL